MVGMFDAYAVHAMLADIDGGMRQNLYDSMAEGVTNAGCVVCFMTKQYELSENVRTGTKTMYIAAGFV